MGRPKPDPSSWSQKLDPECPGRICVSLEQWFESGIREADPLLWHCDPFLSSQGRFKSVPFATYQVVGYTVPHVISFRAACLLSPVRALPLVLRAQGQGARHSGPQSF